MFGLRRLFLVFGLSILCSAALAEPWAVTEPSTWPHFQQALTAWDELLDVTDGISMAQSAEVALRLDRVLRSPFETHQTGRYIFAPREAVPADVQRTRAIIQKGLDHYQAHRMNYSVLFYWTRIGELFKAWGLLTPKEQVAEPLWETELPAQLREWERFSGARVAILSTPSPSRRRELQLTMMSSLAELMRIAPSRALPFAQGLLDEQSLRTGPLDFYAEVVRGAIAEQTDEWERIVGARLAWDAIRERSPACALVWGASLDADETSVAGVTVRIARAMLVAQDPANDKLLRENVVLLNELSPEKGNELLADWRAPVAGPSADPVASACSRLVFDIQEPRGLTWFDMVRFTRRAGELTRQGVGDAERGFVEDVMPYVLGCPEDLVTAAVGLR